MIKVKNAVKLRQHINIYGGFQKWGYPEALVFYGFLKVSKSQWFGWFWGTACGENPINNPIKCSSTGWWSSEGTISKAINVGKHVLLWWANPPSCPYFLFSGVRLPFAGCYHRIHMSWANHSRNSQKYDTICLINHDIFLYPLESNMVCSRKKTIVDFFSRLPRWMTPEGRSNIASPCYIPRLYLVLRTKIPTFESFFTSWNQHSWSFFHSYPMISRIIHLYYPCIVSEWSPDFRPLLGVDPPQKKEGQGHLVYVHHQRRGNGLGWDLENSAEFGAVQVLGSPTAGWLQNGTSIYKWMIISGLPPWLRTSPNSI